MRRQRRGPAAGTARSVRPSDRDDVVARLERLEEEVQECRQLNLRIAELTDLVQELLLPIAQQDREKIAALVERYAEGV